MSKERGSYLRGVIYGITGDMHKSSKVRFGVQEGAGSLVDRCLSVLVPPWGLAIAQLVSERAENPVC